jgi:hypothetical protein
MASKRATVKKEIARPSRAEMADLFDGIVEPPQGDSLKDLKANVEAALLLAAKINDVEEMLKALKSDLNQKLSKFIPDAMRACAMKEYTHESGMIVKLKEFISGSLPKEPEKRVTALRWIRDNGGIDLIKNHFEVDLERGDEKTRKQVIGAMRKVGVDYVESVDVNHMSLQAFIRERMENGMAVPLDTLGMYAGVTAQIKPPKERKAKAPVVPAVAKPVTPSKPAPKPKGKPAPTKKPLPTPKLPPSAVVAKAKAASKGHRSAVSARS